METVLIVLLILVLLGGLLFASRSRTAKAGPVGPGDAKAEARRWTERLGGQVLTLDPKGNDAARQALSDALERYNAAGRQLAHATTARQAQLAQHAAYQGLYYVRAARTTLGMDPGPEIPAMPGQARSGAVTERKDVTVDGHRYEASPAAGGTARHYYPGGMVAGRPVPRGWYSEPWWKPALVAGTWTAGTYLVASSLFAGMAGIGSYYGHGLYADGDQDRIDNADGGNDSGDGGFDGAGLDGAGLDGDDAGDVGGFDF